MKTTNETPWDGLTAFFSDTHLHSLQKDFREILQQPKADIVHEHSGRLGDLIYYLPVVRFLKEQDLSKNHFIRLTATNRGQRCIWSPRDQLFFMDGSIPVLCPYLSGVIFDATPGYPKPISDGFHVDANWFRRGFLYPWKYLPGKSVDCPLTSAYSAGTTSLPEVMLLAFGINPAQAKLDVPWISVPADWNQPEPLVQGPVFVARSSRHREASANYLYECFYNSFSAMSAITVGTESPSSLFANSAIAETSAYPPCMAEYLTISSLVFAMSQCRYFLGNQSMPFAIAEAMKIPSILEVCSAFPDTLVRHFPKAPLRGNLCHVQNGVARGCRTLAESFELFSALFRRQAELPTNFK